MSERFRSIETDARVSGEMPEDEKLPEELVELRSLLVGEELEQVAELRRQLEDLPADMLQLRAEDLSRILPQAIAHRARQDRTLSEALLSPVEEAIRVSVARDPQALADLLFPVMLPAIRRAISQILNKMIESINQTLEYSLSLRSMRWRVEAWQTRRPFAEIVLLNTLLYRVEQIFLIHRKTGLLLQHTVAEGVQAQDADIISGMLTAIQDFVQDSFGGDEQGSLDTVQMGELNLWVEAGPQMVLAGLIRGNAPVGLREQFQEILTLLHMRHADELRAFQGDTEPFEPAQAELRSCLSSQTRDASRRRGWLFWWAFGAVVLVFGLWLFVYLRGEYRWSQYLQWLEHEPGIVVTRVQKERGKRLVIGMRDPLALDPRQLLEDSSLDPDRVNYQWEAYQDLSDPFLLRRAVQLLDPPASTSLAVERGVLKAAGHAPVEWIEQFYDRAPLIPGVVQLDAGQLLDSRVWELQGLQRQIGERELLFRKATTELLPGQAEVLSAITTDLLRAYRLGEELGLRFQIQITGQADATGPQELNRRLSLMRAGRVRDHLVQQGISATDLILRGYYPIDPSDEMADIGKRSASLQVEIFSEHPRMEGEQP